MKLWALVVEMGLTRGWILLNTVKLNQLTDHLSDINLDWTAIIAIITRVMMMRYEKTRAAQRARSFLLLLVASSQKDNHHPRTLNLRTISRTILINTPYWWEYGDER